MDEKIIAGIISLLAAIIGGVIGAISIQAVTQRRIQMENVTQERAKWRGRIRCLASEVHNVLTMSGNPEFRKTELRRLYNIFSALLNPDDCYDKKIMECIDPDSDCPNSDCKQKRAKYFGKLISYLLKHDWERAKEEVKHPLLQWWKLEPLHRWNLESLQCLEPERQRQCTTSERSLRKFFSRENFRFRWCKLFWTLICFVITPVIIFIYARFIVYVFKLIY